MVQQKIMIFGGYMVQYVIFKMPLESPQSEVCGKSYGHFTETTQNGLKTDTLVFSSHFGNPTVGIMSCIANESFWRLLNLFILGF